MSNRVDELESQVAELQAAVDGLTEELVETRERLRRLESEHGVDEGRDLDREEVEPAADVEEGPDPEPVSEADADSDATESEAEESADSDGNDIIVA